MLLLVTIFGSLPSLSRLRINSFFITKQKKKKKVRLVFGVGCTRVRRFAVVVAGVFVAVAVAIVVIVVVEVVVAEEGFRAFFYFFCLFGPGLFLKKPSLSFSIVVGAVVLW